MFPLDENDTASKARALPCNERTSSLKELGCSERTSLQTRAYKKSNLMPVNFCVPGVCRKCAKAEPCGDLIRTQGLVHHRESN